MWLSQIFYKIETSELVIKSQQGSASGFVSIGQKTATDVKWLGDAHITQEAIEAVLTDGETLYIPDVKLNSYDCCEAIRPLIPQIENTLTRFLSYMQSRENNRGR